MASGRRTQTPRPPRGVKPPSMNGSPWPHIEDLIDSDGTITVGRVAPIDCAAIASDESTMLAALVRNKDESLLDLLQRLDEAIRMAVEEEHYTDEING